MIFPCDSLVISFSVINYVVSLASRVNVASRRKMKKDTLPGVLFYINATLNHKNRKKIIRLVLYLIFVVIWRSRRTTIIY